MSTPTTAWIVIAHGSRAATVTDDHAKVCADLAAHASGSGLDQVAVRPAYLEINEPSIPDAIDAAIAEGARRVVLVPYFLHAGNHTGRDIPAFMAAARERHADVELVMAPHLGPDPRLVAILADRARTAGTGGAGE